LDLVLEDEEDQAEATVIELDRLAVDVKYKRQGFGKRLLLRLMAQMLEATQQVPVDALSLITLDQEAKDWYMSLGFGFRETEPGGKRLLLPIATIQQLMGGSSEQETPI